MTQCDEHNGGIPSVCRVFAFLARLKAVLWRALDFFGRKCVLIKKVDFNNDSLL